MKKLYSLIAVLICTLAIQTNSIAQQNALDFDNVNDEVIAPAGSALIAGSTTISMTAWVYLRNPAPTFPDFDGLAGIRNNVDADFYLLHFSTSSIEARFRNSTGANYDVIGTGVQLNTWTHLALTYDCSTLSLYIDGLLDGSIAASGSIASTTEDFYMGNLLYQTTNYWLDGKLDEVSLWNRALTPAEINCMYNNGVNVTDTDLKLLYDFNEGVAGGNNPTVTTLPDLKQTIDATLFNFALTGTTSNWVDGKNNFVTTNDTICQGDSVLFNGVYYSQAGTYTQSFPQSAACDSLVILNLFVRSINTSLLSSGANITAQQSGATYQWVNCATNTAIVGATSQTYTATANGSYAVVVTLNGCSDTSNCVPITGVGIIENNFDAFCNIVPNPATNNVKLTFWAEQKNITLEVCDVTGKIIYSGHFKSISDATINTSQWLKGVYILKLRGSNKPASTRIVKI
ncbi:MAG: T9SS type A sorting domain-containing protein [Bacteroidetes bacterium]|nr:T9SS type A sorting domain-containing protein [Bacteroidota bacterium]